MLVFMYHYMVFVSREATFGWGSTVGWVGVDLFFVLSGYLISNQVFAGMVRGQSLSLKAFYARRLLRTVPAFYVVLALYFIFPAVMGGREPPALWRFLTFTQNINLQPGTAFSHAWSLCIEEQFYLLLPAIVIVAARHGRSIRLAWALLLALQFGAIALRSALWLRYGREADGAIAGYHPHIYYASLCRFDEFLPGIAVAMLKHFHPGVWRRVTARGQITLAAGAAAVTAMLYLVIQHYYVDDHGYGYFMTGWGYSLVAWAFAILVVAALSPNSMLYRLRIPGAAALAAGSYAIYLTHKPLAFITSTLLPGSGPNSLVLLSSVTLVCLAGGWLLHRLVETPFMRYRDRRFPSLFPTHRGPAEAFRRQLPG